MRVFVTGGSGYIGAAVVAELVNAGHKVAGLARSEKAATKLAAVGVEVRRGSLEDLASLQRATAEADGVIHIAFGRNFSDFAGVVETDRRAIAALGEQLEGSDRPLVVASGTALVAPGRLATEADPGDPAIAPRMRNDEELLALADRGVRAVLVRLATSVHGEEDKRGFVPGFIKTAREKGFSAFVGDGSNRWPAVHQLDAAVVFRRALESAPAGSRVHAIADEGIPFREIAAGIARGLDIPTGHIPPEDAAGHFGAFGDLAFITGVDIPASNAATRALLGWEPRYPGLLEDLEAAFYFDAKE